MQALGCGCLSFLSVDTAARPERDTGQFWDLHKYGSESEMDPSGDLTCSKDAKEMKQFVFLLNFKELFNEGNSVLCQMCFK